MNSEPPSQPSRPPILARLHDAPTAQGLTIPYLTLRHHGHITLWGHRAHVTPVWGAVDPERYALVLALGLCQICGNGLGDRVVVFARPQDWLRGIGPEAGLHPECADYSARGCPMLAGRMPHYRSTAVAARFTPCDNPECGCRLWIRPGVDSEEALRAGQPADAWYALWLNGEDYQIVHHPGDGSASSGFGVQLRGVRVLRIRKIRDAAAPITTVLDLMAAADALSRIIGTE